MTRTEPELLGQTVVLIGGSAGIGLETARRGRTEGAEVVLTAGMLSASYSSPSTVAATSPWTPPLRSWRTIPCLR